MVTIKDGYCNKPLNIIIGNAHSGRAELWIEFTHERPKQETLSYVTRSELLQLKETIQKALKKIRRAPALEPIKPLLDNHKNIPRWRLCFACDEYMNLRTKKNVCFSCEKKGITAYYHCFTDHKDDYFVTMAQVNKWFKSNFERESIRVYAVAVSPDYSEVEHCIFEKGAYPA